ncbi:MAG: hypothetical protein R3309_16825, partial [Reinekea sp.]|nr:hypothetical protein [Reinekea sp.]
DVNTEAAYALARSVHNEFETYVLTNNQWPVSFTDLGFANDTLYSEDGSLEMDIYENGVIGVWLGSDSEGDGQYLVTEAFFDDDDNLYWTCYGENYYGTLPADCQ